MDNFSRRITMNRSTVRVLEEIRKGAENPLLGKAQPQAEKLFRDEVLSLLETAGMSRFETMHYGWFLRELSRLWCNYAGRDLAFHLELCMRKWLGYGLKSEIIQFLVTEIHLRLKARGENSRKAE